MRSDCLRAVEGSLVTEQLNAEPEFFIDYYFARSGGTDQLGRPMERALKIILGVRLPAEHVEAKSYHYFTEYLGKAHVKESKRFREIPIILTTVEPDGSDLLREARELGVAAVVKKPWKPQELRAVVQSVLHEPRL